MRPTYQILKAAGVGAWIPLSYLQRGFVASLAVFPSEDANLTYKVQFTLDDPSIERQVSASQTTTTITVTDIGDSGVGHGLITGDDVILKGCGSSMDGDYVIVSTPSATTYTLTSAISQTASSQTGARATTFKVLDDQTMQGGSTDRTVGKYDYPIQAVRLNLTAYVAGLATLVVLQGTGS